GFKEETAGSLMQAEFVWVRPNYTASKAIEKIRVSNSGEELHNVFVLNAKNEAIGILPLRRLVLAKPSAKISNIMSSDVFSVQADTDQEKVAKKFKEKDLISMPVVDSENRMLGIITVDDVIDVLEEEATEDIYRLAGVDEDESVFSSPLFSISKRAPWLTINLFTAVLAAFSIALFENLLLAMATIAIYLPIVAGMGGNAGTQTLAIMVRGLALGEVSVKEYKRALKKELIVGLANGLITGLVVMGIVFLWKGTLLIGFILLLAMVINLLVAAAAGTMVPLLLKWKKIDPALASSIIITTFTDVFGFIAFLGIATIFWKAGLLA
ncbi:MAG: magnesium transporter, partial [Candidatus Diapherotrites archaeon]